MQLQLLAAVLATSVALGPRLATAAPPPAAPVTHAQPNAPAREPADAQTRGTWLRLRGPEGPARDRLDVALQDEAQARGLVEGHSALQVDDVACAWSDVTCLAEAGHGLHTRSLLYGELTVGNDGMVLRVARIDVERAELVREYAQPIAEDTLLGDGPTQVAIAAMRVLDVDDTTVPDGAVPLASLAAPRPSAATASSSVDGPPPPPADRRVRFGLEVSTPKWKWAGLGSSIAVTSVTAIAAIGLAAALRTSLRKDLRQAVDESLEDSRPENDIPRNTPDYCVLARQSSDGGLTVKNAQVTRVCIRGVALERAALGTGITALLGLASTLVFTGLITIHRGKRLRRDVRSPRVTALASPRFGGVAVSGRF